MRSKYFLSFLVFVLIFGCNKNEENEPNCEALFFGNPTSNTGLSSDICRTDCPCKDYQAKTFSNEEIANLKSWKLSTPQEELTKDPYKSAVPQEQEGICAIVVEDAINKTYRLENFPTKEDADAAGAILTHYGLCGLCSSLQDLAVYVENQDLGGYTRQCGFQHLAGPFNNLVQCMESVGFTTPCAQIWSYNVKHTQANCFDLCIDDILNEILTGEKTPFNNPDGSLNECIACDENISGPIFKAYSGRTRRNSGLPSAICRKCDQVKSVNHTYPM